MEELNEQEFKDGLEAMARDVVDRLVSDRKGMLKKGRKEAAAFVKRLRARWSRSLKLTDLFLHCSAELGHNINEAERPKAVKRQDAKFEAVIRNHARIVQVGREALVLAENGYASGATARWRTMHEIAVVALFLCQQPPEISERYLAHDAIESKRSANRHREHAVRLNCEAPTQQELDAIDKRCAELEAVYGKEFKVTNGWASPCFTTGSGKRKDGSVTFEMIEKATNLDHWRPRYLIASQSTHAPSKATYWSVAAGPMHQFLHCGPSNTGLSYALHPVFLSCNMVSGCLVKEWPGEGAERLQHLFVLNELEQRAAAALVEEEPELDSGLTAPTR